MRCCEANEENLSAFYCGSTMLTLLKSRTSSFIYFYSWCQKKKKLNILYDGLKRALFNLHFLSCFVGAAFFSVRTLPYKLLGTFITLVYQQNQLNSAVFFLRLVQSLWQIISFHGTLSLITIFTTWQQIISEPAASTTHPHFYVFNVHFDIMFYTYLFEVQRVVAPSSWESIALISVEKSVETYQYLTVIGPCIVIYSYSKSRDALFLKFILVKNSACFGQIYCPSSGVPTLYTQQ